MPSAWLTTKDQSSTERRSSVGIIDDIMDAKSNLSEKEKLITHDLAMMLASTDNEVQCIYVQRDFAMPLALVLLSGLEAIDNDKDDHLPRV